MKFVVYRDEAVKNVNILTDSQLSKVRALVGGYVEAKNKFNEAETAQDALANSMGSTTQKAKEQAVEVAGLSEEIKKLLGTNKEAMLKNTSLNAMIGAGADPKLAEYLYEARKAQGILGTSKMLSEDVRKSVLARYNSEIGLNKTLEERAKIEERNKKLIEAQGDAMKVNALVASNAAKFNFKGIEAKNGLPTGLLSAIHMQESRGNANAYNESSGATGGFQFLTATAKQYGVKDRYSLAQSAEGAGKYLAYLLKTFNGDIEKAISAYHAGEGNVQRGTNIGPINRQYVKNVKGYMGGASGVSFTEGYSYDDWLKEQEKFSIERERREKEQAAKQLDLTNAVATEKVRINTKLAQDIKSIEEAGFPESESKKLIAEYQRRADIDIQIADAAQIDKLSSFSDYTKSEEQLLNESYARRQRDLKLDISLTIGAYTEASAHIEKQRLKDLQKIRQAMYEAISNPLAEMQSIGFNASAQASLSPKEFQQWQLGNEHQAGYSQLADSFLLSQKAISENELISETEKYAQLQSIYEAYLQNKSELSALYAKQEQDLVQSQHDAQMSIWQDLLTRTGTIFNDMAAMVKETSGESSAAYKAMFLVNQGISMAQALINTEVAATKAMAEGGMIAGIPMATAIRALGYASVGMIAAQTITGMAHDGIDNIPKEGTWLLDGGERVLNPQQNKDLTNYLKNSPNSSNGDIIINNNGSNNVTATKGSDGKTYVTIDEVEQFVTQSMARPNSRISKAVGQNTTASRRR